MFQQTIISMPYLTTNSAKCWYLNGKQFKLNWMFWRVPHTYILGSCCESASASLTISCGCLDSQSAIYMHLSNQNPKMSWFGTWSLFSSLVLWLSITWFWNSWIFFYMYVSGRFCTNLLLFWSFCAHCAVLDVLGMKNQRHKRNQIIIKKSHMTYLTRSGVYAWMLRNVAILFTDRWVA